MKLNELNGIGSILEKKLNQNNIYSLKDLLFTFPKSYNIYKVDNSKVFFGEATIKGLINSSIYYSKKKVSFISFTFLVDGINIKCNLFNMDFLKFKLQKGMNLILHGKMLNNEFVVSKVFFNDFKELITPNYKLKGILDTSFNKIILDFLYDIDNLIISETLPLELLEKYKLYDIKRYLLSSHFPRTEKDILQINRRRKYEELFYLSFNLSYLKLLTDVKNKNPKLVNDEIITKFINNLDYKLTVDQLKAINDILLDTKSPKVMNRLIQGDVGSGKTIVSICASLVQLSLGYQVCVLVPTELLANQTFLSFSKQLDYNVALLTGNSKKSEKEKIKVKLKNKEIDVVVGTHALLTSDIEFNNLGLLIIDEQHKFGVNQRKQIIDKYDTIDRLYLTATPIPRTLGLSSFADLDISSIETMPSGRIKTTTEIINTEYLDELTKILNHHLENKQQIYIVVPNISTDTNLFDINKAYDYFKDKLNGSFGLIYGKQKTSEKNDIMNSFINKDIDILISTTVIEVGINVISANVIVILNAERYGLATLHQLRGRVGRGTNKSYCFLVTDKVYNERLKVLEENSSGFDIAVEDLRLRGPGDYLGEAQSGYINLDYASFATDMKIWEYAKEDGMKYATMFKNNLWSLPKAEKEVIKIKEQSNKIN